MTARDGTTMTAPTWTVTLRATEGRMRGTRARFAEPGNLGLTLCPTTGAITRIAEGVVARLNREEQGSIELGDRIIEVEGKSGRAEDLLQPWLKDGKLLAKIRIKLLRPLLVQPVVLQMLPGVSLGIDLGLASTNIIQGIDAGRVADFNKVYPGAVEVGDRILEVDGKKGNAVELIRAFAKGNKGAPRDLSLTICRRARTFKKIFLQHDFKEVRDPPSSAWQLSVAARMPRPGESLGIVINIDNNCIAEIEAVGAIADLNRAHPGAVQVGDRVLTVDGVSCPYVDTTAKLQSWFHDRMNDQKKDLRLTLLRPVERAADVSVLPPCEHRIVELDSSRLASVKTVSSEDEQSACTSSTTVSRTVSDVGQWAEAPSKMIPSVKDVLEAVASRAEAFLIYEDVEDLRKRGRLTKAWMR
jgi:membrane-associated protease RseP (regulator of RpoE activity)